MRSAQLFRNGNAIRVFRPFWDSSRSQKFGRSSINQKDPDSPLPDPYEGNFSFVDCNQFTKVSIIGAAGRVGRTLSLLLKTCPLIDHLCLFDTDKSVKGIGVDISHIDTKCSVSYVCGMRNIQQALDAPDVVIIAAGCPASPHLVGRKLFDKNAPIIAGLSEACARFCPKACVILITSPINSLLPVVGSVYQIITNKIPSRKLFGLTTLDVVRANTFVAEVVRKDPNSLIVPVIGGTSQETLVPVISQMKPCCKIKRGEMIALTECLKRAEDNLMDCQNCGTRGASSLSSAYAGFRFTSSLLMALKGADNIIECAFVKSDVIPELEYLASPLKLGVRGIEFNYGYPPLSDGGEKQSVEVLEETVPDEVSALKILSIYERPKLLGNFYSSSPSARGYHTMYEEHLEEKRLERKLKRQGSKRSFWEKRPNSLMPIQPDKQTTDLVIKRVPKTSQTSKERRVEWKQNNFRDRPYKILKVAAKQKYRSFNSQKKFTPSAAVMLHLDQQRKEKANKSLELVLAEAKKKHEEINKKEADAEESKSEEEAKEETEDKELIIQREKDRYREFILQRLQELKRENEELKKRLSKLTEDKRLETALQTQSDSLELEKTKLKACWLIMSSTMDAFSNFCKKFTVKADNQIMEETKKLENKPEEEKQDKEEEEYEDALEEIEEEDKTNNEKSSKKEKYDEKYFNFLQKLMEDHMENELDSGKRNRVRK